MAVQVLNIINEKGLHARASAKFVEVVERFNASCTPRWTALWPHWFWIVLAKIIETRPIWRDRIA